MGTMSDWFDGYGNNVSPSSADPRVWVKGQRRILVEVMCCEGCGRTDALRRRDVYGRTARWECESCGNTQKEMLEAGRNRAHLG